MLSNDLLVDLYAGPLNAARWSVALDRLCEATGACSCVLQVLHADRGQLRTQWRATDSRSTASHTGYDAQIGDDGNARLSLRRALGAVDKVVRDDDLFDRHDPDQRRLQRQLQALGLGRFMGVLRQQHSNRFVSLALHRAVGDTTDFGGDHARTIAELAPHLTQANLLRERLDMAHPATATPAALPSWQPFDGLSLGLLLCTVEGQVLAINRAAEAALQTSPWLGHRDGRLLATGPGPHTLLLRSLRRVADQQPGGLLVLGHGPQQLHVAIQRHPGSDALSQPQLTVLVSQPGLGPAVPTPVLAELFALTAAEARLLGALVDGLTLADYAQRRGVSVGTVRGQLKQVLAKTGATRQADLVRLVLTSVAAQLHRVH